MDNLMQHRPVKRSFLRLQAGKWWFTNKRRIKWLFSASKPARIRKELSLPYVVFTHATPLMRQLRNADMRLQINKVINLRLAAERLNGIVLMPGETFSFWRTIGKPTRRKGYVDGMILFYDGYKPGVGGGLCQMSNLIYWMTLHTPLQVTERHRHGYDVFPDAGRTQPFGSGATCAYNDLDLRIHNPTKQPFQLIVGLTEGKLVGEWRSSLPVNCRYEVVEKDHRIELKPCGGYVRSNSIYRRTYALDEGELLDEEFVAGNEAVMLYAPMLEPVETE
ncbi:vancomycin resistance protein VanW [Paenibacillus sp. BK033]|uniref:VanW family protein n=1 Tax=Paenibacillus sp. BK033 TaxID=2512133 RepID=UPI001052E4AC|nr:VanW family protein [Paenibacillus sp. BK033]TCM98809.1 vancomycin resistance protein VanW [Paenibacillus sp. BK033]